ncbi:hypothetical protein Taro_054757 [Colocasia esculenta]|uniref:Uncharacterized protein n=1 Tax=Colocasia esculenta TaxID=4460 RepID=A0A843XRC7_COLES|nr:hypothetical protein [Colocasia esculenta]
MMSRPAWRPRHHRDALGCHDKVATTWSAATVSQQTWVEDKTSVDAPDRLTSGSTEFPTVVFSVPLVVSSFASALLFVGETSQQRKDARRAEETGQ